MHLKGCAGVWVLCMWVLLGSLSLWEEACSVLCTVQRQDCLRETAGRPCVKWLSAISLLVRFAHTAQVRWHSVYVRGGEPRCQCSAGQDMLLCRVAALQGCTYTRW
jgi:hypothetical protein